MRPNLQRALEIYGDAMQTQAQIVELLSAREYHQAFEILSEQLRLAPDDWYANYLAGICFRFVGSFDHAVAHLTAAAKARPAEPSVLLALGIAYQLGGQLEQSVSVLKRAIQADDNFIEAYNSLGLTYRKLNRPRDALEWYERGTDRLMKLVSDQVHADPSKCYRDEVVDGKTTRTLLPYVFAKTKELLKSNLTYAALRNNAGVCRVDLGDFESARTCFEDAIECTPDGYDYPDPARNLENLGR